MISVLLFFCVCVCVCGCVFLSGFYIYRIISLWDGGEGTLDTRRVIGRFPVVGDRENDMGNSMTERE